MKNLLKTAVCLLLLAVIADFSASTTVSAAPAPATNGYTVSPVRTDLTIKPGASDTVSVYIQNSSSAQEHLQVLVNDFQPPKNETGYPSLLLNGQQAPSHSLKQFVTIPNPTFSLRAGQQKKVSVNIAIPAGTAAGGYYGAIRFAPVGASGNKNVNLSASVASLVLITVPGNLIEKMSIAGFGVAQGANSTTLHSMFFSNKNLHALVRFKNSGNVQLQPFGKVELKKGSKVLATYTVNGSDQPGNVLPDSIRRFSVKLNKVGSFGKYTVVGNFGYGSKGQLLSAKASFWVIPIVLIIIIIVVVLLILFLIFGLPRIIRAYNRRVVERADRRRGGGPGAGGYGSGGQFGNHNRFQR